MGKRLSAGELLRQARALYDAPGSPLAQAAPQAGRSLFASGGQWMRHALEHLRGEALPGTVYSLNGLGFLKYGLACLGMLAVLATAFSLGPPWVMVLAVPVAVLIFYALEAQMVFLFPLALDGSLSPFRDARRWTIRAGGTGAVMRVVLPIAAVMLFGGLVGRGFLRSWCLGCLAICLWYEELRRVSVS